MRIRAIGFVGTHTRESEAMSAFVGDVLGLEPTKVPGMTADAYTLPNGDVFVVGSLDDDAGVAERTVGFIVDELDSAIGKLHAAAVETDGISENDSYRYTHFRAPDGRLYELVERKR